MLVFKSKNGTSTPNLIPIGYQPIPVRAKISIVYYHCAQCPRSGWTLKKLENKAKTHRDLIMLQVFETGNRADVERLGIAHETYVNGRPMGAFPQDPDVILDEIEAELARG